MKLAEAQLLHQAIGAAIDDAIASGRDEIELTEQLDKMDDAARASLEAAIKRAGG